MGFSKSEFWTGMLVSDTRYKHFRNQNINLISLFINQFDYILVYYSIKLKISKYNIYRLFFNLLIKSITKKLLYYNANKLIKKVSTILLIIFDNIYTKYKFQLKNGFDKIAK